jgi:S-adenosyl-L-methionine hydrolase (adenosine-forming)
MVDITHNIPSHQIRAAAFILSAAYHNFPPGTVHLAVIDPGVGSERRPVLVETSDYLFVGPDNGVFSTVLNRHPKARVRHVTNSAYFMPSVSATFHGRDIFAPVAAELAKGLAPELLGPIIQNQARLQSDVWEWTADGTLRGSIIHIDHFGNCITSFAWESLQNVLDQRGIRLRVRDFEITRLMRYYEEAKLEPNQPFAIVGSAGFLEISVWCSSAARVLEIEAGEPVRLELNLPKPEWHPIPPVSPPSKNCAL